MYVNHNAVQISNPLQTFVLLIYYFLSNQGAMIRPMIFEDTVKRGICSTPDLFIHPSTSASLSCTHVLLKMPKQFKKNHQQAKGKQQIGTIPLFIKGACNLR